MPCAGKNGKDYDNNSKARKIANAEVLTANDIRDYNNFGEAEKVTLKPFKGAKVAKGTLSLSLPAKSIVTLTLD